MTETHNPLTLTLFLSLPYPVSFLLSRLAVQRDTCAVVAVSLNLSQKQHPRIWTVDKIPSDAFRLIALPVSTGGGALVVSPNSVSYFNQNVRYGISVNEFSSPLDIDPPYHLGKRKREGRLERRGRE
jgi:cleavage and polyadenylation specificity factor subunit 1